MVFCCNYRRVSRRPSPLISPSLSSVTLVDSWWCTAETGQKNGLMSKKGLHKNLLNFLIEDLMWKNAQKFVNDWQKLMDICYIHVLIFFWSYKMFCSIYSYKRSAALSQFVMHRGLIISTMQAVFCSVFYFASIALFPGFLMIG